MLQAHISSFSSSPFIWMEEGFFTYQEFYHKVQELSFVFIRQGIKQGHRVAFLAETNLSCLVTFFALIEIGASPCPMSFRLPKEKIPSYLSAARAHFLVDVSTGLASSLAEKFSSKDQAILLFTSGSSGTPKLVSLTLEHFIANAKNALINLQMAQTSRWLLCVPFFHVSGLSILFRTLLSGSSIAFTRDVLQGDPLATHVSLVPTQLMRILAQNSAFPNLRCALVGGAQISENLVKCALSKSMPLYLTYGMSEMASQITMTDKWDPLIPVHVGKPLPGRSVSIAQDGQILVKGSCLFTGYDSPLGIQRPLNEDGWFATGDLGSFDVDGNLRLLGRKDNMFISGGENIHPETIEDALGTIPGVLSSLVVPLEHAEYGQRPVAFVHMENKMLSKEEFHERLSSHLPKFCLPIDFLPFPKDVEEKSFKLKRKELISLLPKLILQER